MPTRTPIIPNALGNRILLRALHNEMQEKELIKPNTSNNHPESITSSSGVHSNSASEDSDGEKGYGTLTRSSKKQQKAMARTAADAGKTRKSKRKNDSSDSEDSDNTDRSSESGRSDDSTSSSDENEPESSRQKRSWLNEHLKEKSKKDKLPTNIRVQPKANEVGYVAQPKRSSEGLELTERDKQEIREGYERFVVNGERPPTGTSFGARMSAFSKVNNKAHVQVSKTDSQIPTFPLEEAAAGEGSAIGIKEAKRFERVAKQKTRIEKRAIAEAKLTVSEAKLTEFEAKLRARQARIDERHAKLCHRRAIIKRAEERLQLIEARLDEEEECQRERERKVKNRDRRVKTEEAGIQIKEAGLKKRELKVTENLKDIERRKKLVEEKESMSSTMEEIMIKRETLYRGGERRERDRSNGNSGTLGRLLGKGHSKDATSNYASLGRKNETSANYNKSRHDKSSTNHKSTAPIPIPRKSLENRDSSTMGKKKRSNSLDSESVFSGEESSRSGKANGEIRQEKFQVGSLPRRKNKNAIMGLWL